MKSRCGFHRHTQRLIKATFEKLVSVVIQYVPALLGDTLGSSPLVDWVGVLSMSLVWFSYKVALFYTLRLLITDQGLNKKGGLVHQG